MSSVDYEKALGSNARPFRVQLKDYLNAPVDVGLNAVIRFRFKRRPGDAPRLDVLGTFTDTALGLAEYDWLAAGGDFNAPGDIGLWRADALVTYSSGRVDVFPSGGYWLVSIRKGEGA